VLSSADRALALRDSALPGLGLLLDEQELGTWLSTATGDPVRLRTSYLRYKFGTSCVLAGHLDTAQGPVPCLVSAYTGADFAKLAKTLQRAPEGSVLGVDLTRGLVATTPAADRDLPALSRLEDDTRRRRLLRAVLGDRHGLRGARLETLRHKPHRRWIGLVSLGREERTVLRVYRPAEARRATHAIEACGRLDVAVSRLLGADIRRGVAAVEYVPGDVLFERAANGPAGALAGFRAAGAALGRLHASSAVMLRSTPRAGEAHAVRAAATQLAVLLPDQAEDIRQLASTLSNRLATSQPARVPIHGDFSAEQVVVGDADTATLIDLDSARLGEPASDLACAAAALARDAVIGRLPDDAARSCLHALHEGYAAVAAPPQEQRLVLLEAAHLFRRAVEPFRLRQTEQWPDATREMVDRARARCHRTLVDGVR
jgi:hypothetical protein